MLYLPRTVTLNVHGLVPRDVNIAVTMVSVLTLYEEGIRAVSSTLPSSYCAIGCRLGGKPNNDRSEIKTRSTQLSITATGITIEEKKSERLVSFHVIESITMIII